MKLIVILGRPCEKRAKLNIISFEKEGVEDDDDDKNKSERVNNQKENFYKKN